MAFADWPAGFTFFEHREGLRQFTLAVIDALRRSVNADISLRSNFILAFQKVGGTGYRQVTAVCSYCGGGEVEELPGDAGSRWKCRACGRITEPSARMAQILDGQTSPPPFPNACSTGKASRLLTTSAHHAAKAHEEAPFPGPRLHASLTCGCGAVCAAAGLSPGFRLLAPTPSSGGFFNPVTS